MSDRKDALGRIFSRRSVLTKASLLGVGLAGSGTLLAACGDGSGGGASGDQGDGGPGEGGAVTWASWANPGEAARFREVSKDYESEYGTDITYQIVTGDYESKLLTQLAGGSAPDAFYVSTEGLAKLIESNSIVDLT